MTGLIITNGDRAVAGLAKAGHQGEILPWRDVLHEGPVPEGLDLERLSARRARYLAQAFARPLEALLEQMKDRDAVLRGHETFKTITLWFEHDLYDQLQLLQILDFFKSVNRSGELYLVQADGYLGRRTPDDLRRQEAKKELIGEEQLALASEIFAAFRKPDPLALARFLGRDLKPLPFMQKALRRLFEELPDRQNGLSRTQRQALTELAHGQLPPGRLFGAVQTMEEAVFMGDWSFWRCLEELAFNQEPLLQGLPHPFNAGKSEADRKRYLDAALSLTEAGRAVLANRADHGECNHIDRWLGGAAITRGSLWRWDAKAAVLASPTEG